MAGRPPADPPPRRPVADPLATLLQRSVSERRVGTTGDPAAILARAPRTRTIQGEEVAVTSKADQAEAHRIMHDIAMNYGITIDSGRFVAAVKKDYSSVRASELRKAKRRFWSLQELRAVERACGHFAPILGKTRATSSRKAADQDVTVFGKATTSFTEDSRAGEPDDATYGEQFQASRAAGLYQRGESNNAFAYDGDEDKNFEWIATHELAHGLMNYLAPSFVAATGYWRDPTHRSGAGETPFSNRARKSADEDLAQATAAYFMMRTDFATKCPRRYAIIDAAVRGWQPAPAAGAAAGTAAGAGAGATH